MSWKLRVSMLAAGICLLAMFVAWTNPFKTNSSPRQQPTGESIARYAIDDFVAACRLRPKQLVNHAYFGSLLLQTFLPHSLSPARLEAMDIEELVVFCGPVNERDRHGRPRAEFEWAAVARSTNPIDLETVSRQLRQSLVPREQVPEAKPTPFTIERYQCFRVDAGTFFPPRRNYGQLRFVDRNGLAAKQGVNIGKEYEYRSYVAGATKAAAIFTFEGLNETDLVDGHLPLELRPDVFLVRSLVEEYASAQIELRNPDNTLRSEPLRFEAKSFVNHKLSVPRTLAAIDSGGERQADLLKDFVSKGRLEVILSGIEPSMYLGVGPYDLNLRPIEYEYVFVSGNEIVVTQSPDTLKKMLAAIAESSSLANRLSEPDAAIVLIAAAGDPSRQVVMEGLMHTTIGDNPLAMQLEQGLTDITATASDDLAEVLVTAEFSDNQEAGEALNRIKQAIRALKVQAPASISDSLNRLDTLAALTSFGLGGVSMSFPDRDSPAGLARASELLSLITDLLDGIDVKSAGNVVTLQWRQPDCLSKLSEAGQFAVANMEEFLARDSFSREQFDAGDEMFKRVTTRFPHAPEAWFRRAHHLAYNTSVEFDGYENRYAWVRRGLDVLLDGTEQNPDSTDLTWMTARFVGWKIGDADQRSAYRVLFSRDERLHDRMARVVELGAARSPNMKVDNWLVAKLLFERCIERQAEITASSAIPPLLFFWGPAAAQAGYAQSLSEAASWSEAHQAWKEAERLYGELGDREIPVGESHRIRLNDLEARSIEFGENDAVVKQLQAARNRIQFDYWLMRCELEQSTHLQSARKLWHEATENVRRSELRKAYDSYRHSLQKLSEVRERYPTQMAQLAGDFQQLVAGYRNVAEQLGENGEMPSILSLIEQSQPVPKVPLSDWPDARDEGSSTPK